MAKAKDDIHVEVPPVLPRYVVLDPTEPGFATRAEAQAWINRTAKAKGESISRYRIGELRDIDKTTAALVESERLETIENAFQAGRQHERKRLRNILGLEDIK